MCGHASLIARTLAAALLVCAAGEALDLPEGPSSRLQQASTFPPPQPAALHALPWALAVIIGAASCLWLLQRHHAWRHRQRKRQRQQALESTPAAAPRTAALSALRRSADGTILSPFHKDSSLPPFSSYNSPVGSPKAPNSAGALAAEAARRLAALLALPTAGSLLRVPWLRLSRCEDEQPLSGQAGAQPQQLAVAAVPSPSTPQDSKEQLQDQSGGSLTEPRSSGWATPPPELARHLAALQQSAPPPAAGSQQQQQQQQQQHGLSASSLPPRLRELFVEPSEVKIVSGLRGRLGEGASGYVVKARFQEDIVAAKVFDLSKSRELRESFLTECSRLAHLRHPNIVTLLGMSMTRSGKGILLMELAEGRDLFSALQLSRSGGASGRVFGWWRQGARVAVEIARALNYCHHKGYVHGDIKTSNVLLTAGSGNGTAKLADIAFSRHIVAPPPELESFDSFGFEPPPLAGTFAWMAPEVLLGSPTTPASDVYSFGVVLHEIITGDRPVRGSLRMPRVPEECSQEACDLMMRCLSVDPADRPTAGELLHELQRLKRRSSMDVAAAAEWGAAAAAVAAELPSRLRRHASVGSPTWAHMHAAFPASDASPPSTA